MTIVLIEDKILGRSSLTIVRTLLKGLALIPQPLLPFWEKGSRIEVPLPIGLPCTHKFDRFQFEPSKPPKSPNSGGL
jgi:hypothetical protein